MDSVYSMNIQSSVTGTLCDEKKIAKLLITTWIASNGSRKKVMDKKKRKWPSKWPFIDRWLYRKVLSSKYLCSDGESADGDHPPFAFVLKWISNFHSFSVRLLWQKLNTYAIYMKQIFSFTLAETLWHNECMRTVVAKTKSWKRLSENLYKFSGYRRIHANRIKMARNRCELCVKSNFFFRSKSF